MNKNKKQVLLKKMIVVSLFIAISFFLEMVFVKLFYSGHNCHITLIRIELLPLILIGFLFGWKFSFFSNLLYVAIHICMEYAMDRHFFELLLKDTESKKVLFLGLLFFVFVVPYLACTISGFFHRKELRHLSQGKVIAGSLSLIAIVQIISYAVFSFLLYHNQSHEILHEYESVIKDSNLPYKLILGYYILSVVLQNIVIGFILYFLNPILKVNLESFSLE
ncbi:MAG: ECF transporter S component [Candidatus Phytoplasma pruni]|uniref:ECF transporter S component n=1 Tax=Milkweed yellows phytoplasma TaxID=208434 RepID=UPI0003639A51|nr:ECF transporter S component [Milkweed yellows phytoplasma]